MDEIRKGQIALLLMKNQLREEGIRLTPNFRQELANKARSIGISVDEATRFMELIVRELVEEGFSRNHRN